MKKVLFGIMALSTAAFAVNPGVPTTDGSGTETASVPVRVIAEIVKAPVGLTITDESGTALQELVIDHGQLVKGNVVGDSVAFKNFRVRRYDASGAMVALAPTAATAPKLEVSLDNTKTILKKGGTSATSILNSDLTLAGGTSTPATNGDPHSYIVNLTADTEQEHLGKVTSVIPNSDFTAPALEAGFHHNSAERTLTVVYTPGN